jgi:hypothetical protein
MSCRIPASNLEEALFNAFRKDINKYKHLTAVINDMLKLNIPQEAKMHAVWYYSGFMHSAAFKEERLQTKEWSEGKYLMVHQMIEPMITGKIPFDYSYMFSSEQGLQSIFPDPMLKLTKELDRLNNGLEAADQELNELKRSENPSKEKIEELEVLIEDTVEEISRINSLLPGAPAAPTASTLFELEKLKKRNGKLGEQGATAEGVRDLLKFLGIDLEGVDTTSIKAMADFLKNNPSEKQKVIDFVRKEPVQITKFPEDYYELQDGNHRAVVLYYSGVEYIPAVIKDLSGETKPTIEPYTGPFGGTSPEETAPVIEDDIPPTTEELINSEIAELAIVSDVNLHGTFKNVLILLNANKEEITLDMALGYLDTALREVNSRKDSSSKVTLSNAIQEEIRRRTESKEKGDMYVPLRDTEGIGLNMYEFRRANGEKFEASWDAVNNQYIHYDPSNPEIHKTPIERQPGDQIMSVYKKDNEENIDKETLKLRMKMANILTGLTINGKNAMEQMAAGLPIDVRFYDAIRIVAGFQTVNFNRKRLERIRELFPQISIETSELPVQSAALQAGKGPILTFTRPVEGFTITISNAQGDKSFELDPLANLAFVYPNNSVVPLDIDNPEHVNILKNMLRIRNDNYFDNVTEIYRYEQDITDEQLEQLKKSINTYKAFQMDVMTRLQNTSEQDNVDIRDIFFKYYDLTNSPVREEYEGDEEGIPLAQHINAFEGRLPMVVQKYNENGELIGDPIAEKVPIVVRKTKNVWEVVDTLTLNAASPINKKIIAESGKTYLTIDAYLKGEFGINVAEYMKNFPTWKAAYLNFRVEKDTLKPVAQPMIPKEMVNSPADMVDFIATMLHAFQNASIEKGNTAMIEFDKKGWGFNVIDGIRAEFVVLSQTGERKSFGIKFTMLPNEKNTDEMVERFNTYAKSNLNIKLNRDTLNDLYDNLNKVLEYTSKKVNKNMSIEEVSKNASEAGLMTPVSYPALNELFEVYSRFLDEISNSFSKAINAYETNVSNGRVTGGLLTDKFMSFGLFDGNSLRVYRRG